MKPYIALGVVGLVGILAAGCRSQSPISDQATAVHILTKQTTTLLPRGWSAVCADDAMIVRRKERVRLVNEINRPVRMKGENDEQRAFKFSALWEYRITVRLGDRLTTEQVAEICRQNNAVAQERALFENRMQYIPHKFDAFLPATEKDKELVAEYHRIVASYRPVPRYHFDGFAAYMDPDSFDRDEMYPFYSQQEEQECAGVYASITSCLKKYEQERPNEKNAGDGN